MAYWQDLDRRGRRRGRGGRSLGFWGLGLLLGILFLGLVHVLESTQILSEHRVSVGWEHGKLHFHIIFLKLVLKLQVVTLLHVIILILNFVPSLLKLLPTHPHIRPHANPIQRITFTKLVHPQPNLHNLPIRNRKIIPLPQPMRIRILTYVQPILILRNTRYC